MQTEDRIRLTIVTDAPIGVKDCIRGTLTREDEKLFRFDETIPWFGRHSTQTVMERSNLRITRKKDGSYRVSIAIPAEMKEPAWVDSLLFAKYDQAREWFASRLKAASDQSKSREQTAGLPHPQPLPSQGRGMSEDVKSGAR